MEQPRLSPRVAAFVGKYPRIYHSTFAGGAAGIKAFGLFRATSIITAAVGMGMTILSPRPKPVVVEWPPGNAVTLRDQSPLLGGNLTSLLDDGLTEEAWLKKLDERVFFWLSVKDLQGFRTSKSYRDKSFDVLEVDTGALLAKYASVAEVSRINTGAIGQGRGRRGHATYQNVQFWHALERGRRLRELTVKADVPDIAAFITRQFAL